MPTPAAQLAHNHGLLHHRASRFAEAEPHYRRAIALDPDFTEAWINLGLVLLRQGRPDEAMASHREALRLDPENADAHNNLGMAHYALGHIAEAENSFRAALRLSSAHACATLNLGAARQILNHVDEAEGLFRRALALGADQARVNSNLALTLLEQVRPEEAEQCCREVLAIQPDCKEARANLALALLTMSRLEEGWREYESRWEVEGMAAPASVLPEPRWTGQDLRGRTILLYAEQGFGDTLQFCRYVPMVAAAGGRVVLVVPRALRRLLTTLDGVATLLSEEDDPLPAFDYYCPLLSLPFAFGTTMATIPAKTPYLRADPSAWADFLAGLPGLKVGLVWAGQSRTAQPHAVAIDKRRSMRLADMAPLLLVPGCSFVSLQLGPPAAQMEALPPRAVLHHVAGRMQDWADTAALIAGLDLVIAVDTAVAHLAGALDKPVWMLNRFDSCWRWLLNRDDTPWYPSMLQFRQTSRGDWGGVIERVRGALELALFHMGGQDMVGEAGRHSQDKP
jgi:Flp pilus assembly protein TadD